MWNRTLSTAEAVAREAAGAGATPHASLRAALDAVGEGGVVVCMLSDVGTVQSALLDDAAVRDALRGKVLVHAVSGNPDEGRAIARAASAAGARAVFDGAYSMAKMHSL